MEEFRFEVNQTHNVICKALLCLYAFLMPIAVLVWGI